MQPSRPSWRDCPPALEREDLEDLREAMAAYDQLPAAVRKAMVASDTFIDTFETAQALRRRGAAAVISSIKGGAA